MKKIITVILLLIVLTSVAQRRRHSSHHKKAKPLTGQVAEQRQVEVKLSLRDGNTISGTTELNDILLITSYGNLIIPVSSVSTIRVGMGSDVVVKEQAMPYLKILSSSGSEEIKKGAYTDLVKLGVKAISAIQEYDPMDTLSTIENEIGDMTMVSDESEYNIQAALAEIKSVNNIDDTTPINDILTVDNEYTIGGNYNFQKLDIKTEYGILTIPKEKINTVDILYVVGNSTNDFSFKLPASKYISANQNSGWLKTGITLKQGQRFTILATGEVVLASLSNQKYKPDGSYIDANGASMPGTAAEASIGGSGGNYPSYGNVVYKIGEQSTEVLKVGAKYSGIAKGTGMLYISIYETVYNTANTGAYSVKVNLK